MVFIVSNSITLVILGTQLVTKFNSKETDKVNLAVGIIRLPEISTDLLVSYNHPGFDSSYLVEKLMRIINSLQILDWGLFAYFFANAPRLPSLCL